MNTSTYYDLKLVEGNDKVNPLIVDVPNYEAIDEQMHNNEAASVGVATELASGSAHALTRQTPDAAMFRFVATANYTAGDTFTVDGIQVTALTPSGEALGSGAYVINSNVLCCLVGTVLTIFTSGGTVTLADDSLKLGGNAPEYYATAQAVSEARDVADASSTIATAARTQLGGYTLKALTQGEYDSLTSKDPATLYFIYE